MKLFESHVMICLVFLGILMSLGTGSALRILGLFPMPGRSHYIMGESLMRGLAERGHQVDVYNFYPSKKPFPNFKDISMAGLSESPHNNMSYSLLKEFESSSSIKMMVEFTNPTCELLNLPMFKKLLGNSQAYDLVIVEVFVAHCYLAWGRQLNVPMIGVVAAPGLDWVHDPLGNPVNLAFEPSTFSSFVAPMTFFERAANFLLSNMVTYSFNYHIPIQDPIVKKVFGPDYPSVVDLPKDLSLLLSNHHHAIHGIKSFTPAVVPVGGLHIFDPPEQLTKEVQKFLDESKDGFIYVSFGSMFQIETLPEPIVQAFYQTFEKIKPVRVLMKIAKPEKLPKGLPSNTITYHWLPQVKVLKHKNIRAFVTHGGLMGTQESIYFGVPMVGFPLFGDQHMNVESYVKKNLAIKLDYNDITEPIFTKAVMEILKNPIYKNSAEKVGKMFRDTPKSPMDTAVYWIEYVARHGKDALRSPLVDMPWWQSSLLDVYAFLITCLLVVLYMIKIIVRILISLIRPKSATSSKSKVKKN